MIALLSLLGMPCCAAHADDREAVLAVVDRWMSAWHTGDIDSLMTVYCDDVVLALHGQPMRVGVDAVRAFFDGNIGREDATMRIDIETVRVRGDVAWFTSKYWLAIGAGQERLEDAGRSLLVFERDTGGEWRLCADIDQATPDVRFPAPSTNDYEDDRR
ncbi:MAG: SgcJ/EcaC family oxidoreductase [Pseudomonadota bacterium]